MNEKQATNNCLLPFLSVVNTTEKFLNSNEFVRFWELGFTVYESHVHHTTVEKKGGRVNFHTGHIPFQVAVNAKILDGVFLDILYILHSLKMKNLQARDN